MSKARNLSDFISDPTISTTEIADLAVTHAKLHGTMDLSSKTVTLPSAITDTITNKLPLAGGTLTGLTTVNMGAETSPLRVGSTGNDAAVSYSNASTPTAYNVRAGMSDTDDFSIWTSDTKRLTVIDNGNVGIGTTGPNEALHIYRASGDASFKLQNASQILRFDQNSIRTTTNSPIAMFTNNTSTQGFRIENDGRMIIGQTAGQTNVKLTVAGNVKMGSAATSSWANTINDIGGLDVIVGSGSTGLTVWDDNAQSTPRFKVTRTGNASISGGLRVGDSSISQTYGLSSGYLQTIQAASGNQSYLSITRPGAAPDSNGLVIGEDTSNSYITQRNNKPLIITQNDTNAVLISSTDGTGTSSGGARMYVYGGIRTTTPGGLFTDMYNGGSGFYGTGGYFGGPIFRTPNLGAGSSGEATADIFNMYTSGHWGQGSYIRVCVFTRYYGSGYREYFLRQDRGSSTITIEQRHEGGGENSPYLDVHNSTLVGTSTHSGQTVRRQTVRLRSGGSYHNCHATIEFAQVSNGARVWDSASSVANVDTNARTTGGGIHFLNFRVDNNNSEYNQRNEV
jgi:hypothetical protein